MLYNMPAIFDPGEVTIPGIYGHSASGGVPQPEQTFDVNQVPTMFFDYQVVKPGSPVFAVLIDGQLIKDSVNNTNLPPPGQKRPYAFWIPMKYRTPGRHEITVEFGYTEYKQGFLLFFGGGERVVVTKTWKFGLVFTGTPSLGD
jgi:hypothetical protein